MEKRFENFTMMIFTVEKLVQKIKTFEVKKFGLKAVHVMCIYHLYRCENGMNSTELCKATLEDKAAISRALSMLIEKGYVASSRKDRLGRVSLTEEGKKIANYIIQEADKAVEACGGELSDEERDIFYTSFSKITENLVKYYGELTKNE